MGGRLLGCRSSCGCTFCSSGSTCRVGGGGGTLRIASAAALCEGGLRTGTSTRREHDFAVPPSAREKQDLGGAMLQAVNEYLESRGIRISRGTIVGAAIIHARPPLARYLG